MTFPEHAHTAARAVIKAIPANLARDVYIVTLFFSNEEFDERLPFITVSWNTNEHLASVRARSDPHSPRRREWSAQNFLAYAAAEIGESAKDPAGAALRRHWIEHDLHAWYSDEDEASDMDDAIDKNIEIHNQVLDLIVDIAAGLHSSGLIEQTLGKPVPVFINSFESGDPLTELNHKANPPQLHHVLDRLARKE
jgi:hypothetical protein